MAKKGVPTKDLTGLVFGDFKVVSFIGDGKWNCECIKCGHKVVKNNGTLREWKNYCPKCKSPIGKIFGDFEVLSRKDTGNKYEYVYNCRCINCGSLATRSHNVLKKTRNMCEVCNERRNYPDNIKGYAEDLRGQKFGKLTVIDYAGKQNDHSLWLCECECTRTTTKSIGVLHRNSNPMCEECLKESRKTLPRKELEKRATKKQIENAELISLYKSQGEIFKSIKEFDKYEVGNHGHIISYQGAYPKVVAQTLDSKKRYLMVTLCKNKRNYKRLVHRLVAEAFLANPNNLPKVNHIKSEEIQNNNVDNLEWCTANYNTKLTYQTLPPDRNRRSCILVFPDGTEKYFESYADVRRYHDEHDLDFSKDSLNYYGKSRGFELIKLEKTSNKNRQGMDMRDIDLPQNENYREVML